MILIVAIIFLAYKDDNNFSYNTSVDLKQKHWYFKNQVGANVAACNTNEEQTTFGGHIANEELYYSRYPNLKTITGSSLAGSIFGNSLYKLNTIKNNLSVNGATNSISRFVSSGNSNCTGNAEVSSFDGFVNASGGDFRVKNSSAYGSLGVLNEDFDISAIGIISENKMPYRALKAISPYNNEAVSSENVHFMWNEVPQATKYLLEVSKDSAFENILSSAEVYYNYADISLPDADGSVYYWRVTAKNTSNDFRGEQKSDVYIFSCGEKISASAQLSEDNTIDVKITNNYYKDGIDADIIIAEYDKDGRLINAQKYSRTLSYGVQLSFAGRKPSVTDPENAASVRMFIWDKEFTPLREVVIVK